MWPIDHVSKHMVLFEKMAMRLSEIEALSPSQVCTYLQEKIPNISKDVLEKLIQHKIDGGVFLELSEEYLREVAPLLGDRLKIRRVINAALVQTSSAESSSPLSSTHTSTPKSSVFPQINLDCEPSRKSYTEEYDDELLCDESASFGISDSLADSKQSAKSASTIILCDDGGDHTLPDDTAIEHDVSIIDKKPVIVKESGEVPSDKDWAEKLVIPVRFSAGTNKVLETGFLTKKARVEITTSLSTLVLVHTSRPTPSDLTIVCQRLIEKHPNLRDKVDNGYSSWRRQLRTKFKNLRRPDRAEKAGITVPPAPKKIKISSESTDKPSPSSLTEYERHVSFLQRSYHSKKWTVSSMFTLMKETAHIRTKWIRTEGPSVKDILERFPCLADPRIMIQEFCRQTGAIEAEFKDKWKKYEALTFKYAPLEGRKALKKLLSDYMATESDSADRTTSYALQLLSICLGEGRGQTILSLFEGESIDIDKAVTSVSVKAPSILAFGEARDSPTDIRVVVEGNILVMPSMETAVHFCFASYYVFHISFPSEFRLTLLFLESYVYHLKQSVKKMPLSVITLHDSLGRLGD